MDKFAYVVGGVVLVAAITSFVVNLIDRGYAPPEWVHIGMIGLIGFVLSTRALAARNNHKKKED